MSSRTFTKWLPFPLGAGGIEPLTPLALTWPKKSLDSAKHGVEQLPDGRVRYFISHEVLRGVTPAMLVHWLNHMAGTLVAEGQTIPRYRAWHPTDHYAVTYVIPGADGRPFSAGATIRIQEFFGGDARYAVNTLAHVERLDETGFIHHEKLGSAVVARATYRFTPVAHGTQYDNDMTIGIAGAPRVLNAALQRLAFPRDKGLAWQKHNVEEVGFLECFLPQLCAADTASLR